MNPIIQIVNYLFEKNSQTNTDSTLSAFFGNGMAFPKFLEIIFKEEIPGIIKNPTNASQKKNNNELALNFLFHKNSKIAELSQGFTKEEDQELLLTLILTKQCFKTGKREIISKCNLILRPLNIKFRHIVDLQTINSLLSLLNILTKGKVTIPTGSSDFQYLMKSFQIAEIPLVIDKTSFEAKNKSIFMIQISIIFDFFSNVIKELDTESGSTNTSKKRHKRKHKHDGHKIETIFVNDYSDDDNDEKNIIPTNSPNKVFKSENINEEALLKTINTISSQNNLHFNTIINAIEKDNIIRFVTIFFKENEEDFSYLTKLNSQIKSNSNKIKDLIQFLSKKEPIYSSYEFNFTDPKFQKTTASLFYTKFLDHFLIKRTKEEMIERVKTILFTEINKHDTLYPLFYQINTNPEKEKLILFDWNVYLALVYFVNTGKVHFKIEKTKAKDYSFNTKNIPQIIDKKYLESIQNDLSPIYYQLHFIFNELDKSGFHVFFIETLLTGIKKLSYIRVPSFNNLAINIIPKQIALIEQNKRFKKFVNSEDKIKITKPTENPENNQKDKPLIFVERKLSSLELNNKKGKNVSSSNFQSKEDFWNPIDPNYLFEDGILFTSKTKKVIDIESNIWYEALNKICLIDDNDNQDQSEVLFDMITPQKVDLKVYKFFVYDEENKEWTKNSSSINQFRKDMGFERLNINTNLVLFINSYEKDLIHLNSKLINFSYPNLNEKDDDQIFIYALCGKTLSYLKYKINIAQNDSSQKPIFLSLHVPESKIKMKNIKTIINQIYYFLTIISDIEIIILDEKHFMDQISILENLNKIRESYDSPISKRINVKKQKIMFNNKDDNDVASSDGDEIGKEEEEIYEINDDIFSRMNLLLFNKKRDFILLFNSESIHGNNKASTAFFALNLNKMRIGPNCHLNFININESTTYKDFLTTFNELSLNNLYENEEVFERFDFYEMTKICEIYFQLQTSGNRKQQLTNLIRKRFSHLQNFSENQLSDFDHLSNLQKEIISSCPSIDDNYINDCYNILLSIKNDIYQKNKVILSKELEKSAQKYITYLGKIIKTKDYWDKKTKENIRMAHENYLKNEFMRIIKYTYPKREHSSVFECSYQILENQITKDISILNKILEKKVRSFAQEKQRIGTNYVVTERENEKEIDIEVQTGELDSVFPRYY